MSPSVRVRFVAPQPRSPYGGRNAPLAQLVERRPLKSIVLGSSPRRCTNLALVSQLDRGPGYEPGSCAFESRRGHCDRGVAGLHARLWLWMWRFDSARSPHAQCPQSADLPPTLRRLVARFNSGWGYQWRGQPKAGGGARLLAELPFGACGFDPRPLRHTISRWCLDPLAEWRGGGLQLRLPRFESGRDLQGAVHC